TPLGGTPLGGTPLGGLDIAKKISAPLQFRAMPSFFEPAAIAIGSSTGGPQALFTLLADWPAKLQQPIFITQHMPPTFTTILGEHITRISKRPAAEAKDGEFVKPGRIYIAPGDYHLSIEEIGKDKILRVRQTPPENFCRPSVDPMFTSLSRVYQKNVLAIMLTGMGRDGLAGTQAIIDNGGLAIAQDETSSVVWGMPGTIANAGLCSAVVSLPEMAGFVSKLLLRGAT
ncbi:MAG: CheB methylesterase domain-containing protein, partial [Alphaproteobacteria bacterium]|nr:CheB methylesterase domain-containing protein [Alphaproteobacteria bacterium]